MPSTVTSVDAVSRCSPYCVLKLYLARNKQKKKTAEKVGVMGYLVSDEQLNGSHSPLYYQNTNHFLDVRKRKIDAEFFSLCGQQ